MATEPARPRRAIVVAVLLAAFAIQAGIAAIRDSVTVDELAHLPVGLYFLRHGDFSPDPINPPLSRLVSALPVFPAQPRFDPPLHADEWKMGLIFMRDNADRYEELYARARSGVIALTLLLGLLVYHWCNRLYGGGAALVALALFTFSPSLLAHGHLATVDAAGALGFALGLHQAWVYRQAPSLARAAALGAVIGVALLLKLSSFAVVPAAAVVLILDSPARGERASFAARAGRIAVAALATIVVIGAGYAFQGTGKPLSEIELVAGGWLESLGRRFPALGLPLPEAFVRGFDLIASSQLKGDRSFYLAGEISPRGWWYYHFVAYALKTPLALLALIGLAAARFVSGRRTAAEAFLWAGVGLVFLTGGVLNPLKLGARHVLAAEPLFCILAAPLVAEPIARSFRSRTHGPAAILAALVLLHYVGSSLAVAPRHLQYFNELAGGPSGGHRWLADSNIDWGQDLVRLREFMDDHRLETVDLAYFGTVHPNVYGIRFEPLLPGSSPRPAVISASLLVGLPFPMWRRSDLWSTVEVGEFRWLQELEPIDRVGSMFVFGPRDAG